MPGKIDERIIPLNKAKLFAVALFCYAFVLGALWMMRVSLTEPGGVVTAVVAVFLFAIFVAFGAIVTPKLIDGRPGLILNPDGLWNNAHNGDARLIPWSDIRRISLFEHEGGSTLRIDIGDDPDDEIDQIMPFYLEIGLNELYQECSRYHAVYGGTPQRTGANGAAQKIDKRKVPLHKPRLIARAVLAYALLAAAVISLHIVSSTGGAAFTPWYPYLAGILLIVLFDLLGVGALTRLLDRRPGLILSPDGILDNSGPFAVAFVPWSDIAALDFHETKKGGAVIVKVTDPERYVRSGGLPARIYRRTWNRRLGSPVVLSPNCLRIGFPELKAECARYHAQYGAKAAPAGQSAKASPTPVPNRTARISRGKP